uniref:Serine proteinase stubblelike [Metaseiulus occidentalis] n=3 Tax=Lepeophtheirus salmonis TaxID=72036 RepID=A0A0K2VG90_LEPSM
MNIESFVTWISAYAKDGGCINSY